MTPTSWQKLQAFFSTLSHLCQAQRGSLTALGMKLSSSISSSFSSSTHCGSETQSCVSADSTRITALLFCGGALACMGLCSSSVSLGCPPTSHRRKSPELRRSPTASVSSTPSHRMETTLCSCSSRSSCCLPSDATSSSDCNSPFLRFGIPPLFHQFLQDPLSLQQFHLLFRDLLVQVSDFLEHLFSTILWSFAHQISLTFHHSQKLPLPFAHIFDNLAELQALCLLSRTHPPTLITSRRADNCRSEKKPATLCCPFRFVALCLMSTSLPSGPSKQSYSNFLECPLSVFHCSPSTAPFSQQLLGRVLSTCVRLCNPFRICNTPCPPSSSLFLLMMISAADLATLATFAVAYHQVAAAGSAEEWAM